MDNLLCEKHGTPLTYSEIEYGTVHTGWYCPECDTYYIDADPDTIRFPYNGKMPESLTDAQAELARKLYDGYIQHGFPKSPKQEKTVGITLVCSSCGVKFKLSAAKILEYQQDNRPLPTRCNRCKRQEEEWEKYNGVASTMHRGDTRHVDSKGRQVHRSGSNWKSVDSHFIPTQKGGKGK